MNRQRLLLLALTLGSWVAMEWIIVSLSISFLPFTPTFPYAKELLPHYGGRAITTWAHFDGVHYLTIVEKGYQGTGLIQAFFPLFPLLVRLVSSIIGINPLMVGLGLSIVALAMSIILLTQLYPHPAKGIGLWLLFPTSFFLLAFYTESLFVCLTLGAYYFAKRRRWGFVGILGFLAGLARLPGFLLCLLLVFEAYRAQAKRIAYIAALMPVGGLLTYMGYLGITFHQPLLFYTVQREFGAQRSQGTLIPLITPLFRYYKIFTTVSPWTHAYYIAVQEFFVLLWGMWLTFKLWWKKEYGLWAYCATSLLLPTLTGSLSSLPRYSLVLFPLFIVLAEYLRPLPYKIMMVGFGILAVVNLCLFTQGLWVA